MRVALHGGYCIENFGDLLLFELYSRWVREENADVVYPLIPKANQKWFLKHFPNASTDSNWDVLVFSGGGHFAEPSMKTWRYKWQKLFLIQHVRIVEQAIREERPYAILGVGAGPISNPFFKNLAKRIFQRAALITVRDQESKEFVEELIGKSDIQMVPDAALTISKKDIPQNFIEEVRDQLKPFGNVPLLGIHVTESLLSRSSQADVVRQAILARLIHHPEVTPVVFTDYGTSDPAAVHWFAKLIKRVTAKSCLYVPFENIWKTIALISELSALITSKLHVGIAAQALGIYTESFATDVKIKRFYKQIARASQSEILFDMTQNQIMEKIDRVFDVARQQVQIAQPDLTLMIENALKNKHWLASFLRNSQSQKQFISENSNETVMAAG